MNEIDNTVERIGGYIQECRAYGNTRTLSHEEFAALENLFTAYTKAVADNEKLRAEVETLLNKATEIAFGIDTAFTRIGKKWRFKSECDGDCDQDHPTYDTVLEAYAAIKPKDAETSGEGTE